MGLGDRIRELREGLGWSGNELAERAGLPQSTLHRIESDPESDPSVSRVAAIAKVLGVTVEQLVGDVPIGHRTTFKVVVRDRVDELETKVDLILDNMIKICNVLASVLSKMSKPLKPEPVKSETDALKSALEEIRRPK